MAGTALTAHEKAAVLLLLNRWVLWEAQRSADLGRVAQHTSVPADDTTSASATLLSTIVDAERFPALRPALDVGIFDDGTDRDADLAFGLERVSDGGHHLVTQRTEERHE